MTTPRILLVEDDASLRSVLRRALERAGYRALEAADGRAALDVIRTEGEPVDMVVTDIVMPGMEGIELMISIRKTHPSLPVIAMSGGGRSSAQSYLQIARSAGAVRVLAKPFEIESLLETVREVAGPPAPGSPM